MNRIHIVLFALMLSATSLAEKISFTRINDPAGSEGFRLSCEAIDCSLQVIVRDRVVETLKLPKARAQAIVDEFFRRLPARPAKHDGRVVVTYTVKSDQREASGSLPREPGDPKVESAVNWLESALTRETER